MVDQEDASSYEQEDGDGDDDESMTNPFMSNKQDKKAHISKKGGALQKEE